MKISQNMKMLTTVIFRTLPLMWAATLITGWSNGTLTLAYALSTFGFLGAVVLVIAVPIVAIINWGLK